MTNGQIPYWLDISYNKVTIIQHSQLIHDLNIIPTFSSTTIETLLNLIPNLSKRFLYMNDDIFFGDYIYPEDLYTKSEGVKIYNAWILPDCSIDCPWVYIGDGSCDIHCNIEECQYDGGDCKYDDNNDNEINNYNDLFLSKNQQNNLLLSDKILSNDQSKISNNLQEYSNKIINNSSLSSKITTTIQNNDRKILSFNEMLRIKKNITNLEQIHKFVEEFNNQQRKRYTNNRRRLKNRKYLLRREKLNQQQQKERKFQLQSSNSKQQQKSSFTSTKDIFSKNLIYTNKLLNNVYGFKSRYVLGHVGFLFDKDIINEMKLKFSDEIKRTQLHRFRHSNDIQFAFLYYNFIQNEYINRTIDDIFNEFDTDKSSTWSDREIRTLLTKLYPTSSLLDWSIINYFEMIIRNCSKQLHLSNNDDDDDVTNDNIQNDKKNVKNSSYSTILYERYENSNIVSK